MSVYVRVHSPFYSCENQRLMSSYLSVFPSLICKIGPLSELELMELESHSILGGHEPLCPFPQVLVLQTCTLSTEKSLLLTLDIFVLKLRVTYVIRIKKRPVLK